ncbi:MAG: hypothetical protein KDA42_09205, partial [Planctomycetales bacterium]|nr:hypothetical protein [Planctomycetales bacterium]
QTAYHLAEPLEVPVGSRLRCIAHYDNSANNPANPDPTVAVRFGQQSYNEMMIGYFDVAVPVSGLGEAKVGRCGVGLSRGSDPDAAWRWRIAASAVTLGAGFVAFYFVRRRNERAIQ